MKPIAESNNKESFKLFKNAKQYLTFKRLATIKKDDRIKALNQEKYKNFFSEEIKKELTQKEKPEQYNLIKGVIEFGNTVGSVLGLAIFAPEVSHLIIHPELKYLDKESQSK